MKNEEIMKKRVKALVNRIISLHASYYEEEQIAKIIYEEGYKLNK